MTKCPTRLPMASRSLLNCLNIQKANNNKGPRVWYLFNIPETIQIQSFKIPKLKPVVPENKNCGLILQCVALPARKGVVTTSPFYTSASDFSKNPDALYGFLSEVVPESDVVISRGSASVPFSGVIRKEIWRLCLSKELAMGCKILVLDTNKS